MSTPLQSVDPVVDSLLSLAEVFVLLFVTLGPPIKVPAVYFGMTRALAEPDAKSLAARAFLLAATTAIVGGLVGMLMMSQWNLTPAVLQLTGGLVFFLVSLKSVLGEYESSLPPAPTAPLKAFTVAVPLLVTPYGLVAVIVMLSKAGGLDRSLVIVGLVFLVMLLNFLAMRYARPIMRTIGPIPLQVFGTIVGVMTIGLSIKIVVNALRMMGLVD
jgi:multiple antibiotic resistance protein